MTMSTTNCPMCSEAVAEDGLQRHLRSHGLRLLWWMWKDNPSGAALAITMTATVAITVVAAWAAIVTAWWER